MFILLLYTVIAVIFKSLFVFIGVNGAQDCVYYNVYRRNTASHKEYIQKLHFEKF